MSQQNSLVKEFQIAAQKYRALFADLVKLGVEGVFDPADLAAAGCSKGDISCHGGTSSTAIDEIGRPLAERSITRKFEKIR